MTTSGEVKDGGGAKHPSAVSMDSVEAIATVSRHIAGIAVGPSGGMSPEAGEVLRIRRHDDRDAELRRLLDGVCPRDVNPDFWLKWLRGGEQPFGVPKLKRLPLGEEKSGRQLQKSTGRLATVNDKVAKARRALEDAEAERSYLEALDRGILQFAVSEHLASIIAPLFAMGPAWSVMQILGSHVTPDSMAVETALVTDPRRRKQVEEQVRRQRSASTERIFSALDLWAGDEGFERDVRDAVEAVVETYSDRTKERAQSVKPRSREAMRTSVRPEQAADRDAVLNGMRRTKEG